jgi:hypothetical protein
LFEKNTSCDEIFCSLFLTYFDNSQWPRAAQLPPHLIAHEQAAARGVHLQTGDVAELNRLGAATVAAELEHEGAG